MRSPGYWPQITEVQIEVMSPVSPERLLHLPIHLFIVVIQSLSRVQLCDPMDCIMPGFPVLFCLPEFAQTHVR